VATLSGWQRPSQISPSKAAYFWTQDTNGTISPAYAWSSAHKGFRMYKPGRGSYSITINEISTTTNATEMGMPLVTAYDDNGKYCMVQGGSSWSQSNGKWSLHQGVDCFDAQGNAADGQFSFVWGTTKLFTSVSHARVVQVIRWNNLIYFPPLSGGTWNVFTPTFSWGEQHRIYYGAFSPGVGWVHIPLMPENKTAAIVSAGTGGQPWRPARCKVSHWMGWFDPANWPHSHVGTELVTLCFDKYGAPLDDVLAHVAYGTSQTNP
jgi:hypothetical protein